MNSLERSSCSSSSTRLHEPHVQCTYTSHGVGTEVGNDVLSRIRDELKIRIPLVQCHVQEEGLYRIEMIGANCIKGCDNLAGAINSIVSLLADEVGIDGS